jgi:methionyl-tRNA formyltransferase
MVVGLAGKGAAMRLVFCGTPEFAVPSLRSLLSDSFFSVEAVVTQPDRPRGRGQAVSASPVKQVALEAGAHVYQPESVKSDSAYEFFKQVSPDAVVIIAYGQIIPQRLISAPRLGWINLHASLLPKYRGAAPINWAVVNGETSTGLTTMQIDAGMDTGPILLQQEMAIGADETAPELARRMSEEGAPLMASTLRMLEQGEIAPRAQDGSQASLAPRLSKELGRIDWSSSARDIYNRIRGLAPWPGAYTIFRGQSCHIWGHPIDAAAANAQLPGSIVVSPEGVHVMCAGATSQLRLEAVQMEGRKRVTAREFANGARLGTDERFGT